MPKIKRAKKDDLTKIANLIRTTLLKSSAEYYPKTVIRNLIGAYSAKNLSNKYKTRSIFVATVRNRIVGTAQLTDDGWICGMFIHPKYQNHGIGKSLIEKIESNAKKRLTKTLRSHVAINSVGFYKKLGFRIVKKVRFKEAGRTYRIIKKLG